MDKTTTDRLLALNRAFYAVFARPFAATRPADDPALVRILPYIPRCASVLDVGCGNGRLAHLLDQERPGATCVGVDVVPELIEVARTQAERLTAISAEFHVADITAPGWAGLCGSVVGRSPFVFDTAVVLAVLHHIPGFALRLRVLHEIAGLLEPGGCLILSTWQFLGSPRMRRKVVDWTEVGIVEAALEPGDYLLDWKREGRGLRYCHLVDRAEVERLAAGSGFCVRETFRAGGREGDLSLFAVLDSVA
jgi:tRNA (uracil-5-)-methyltransferase TRM9